MSDSMSTNLPPDHIEPPASRRLLRSTAIAAMVAVALLVSIVMPAEYGLDPTGVGGVLGLTEMGEIKVQLALEAEAEAGSGDQGTAVTSELATSNSQRLDAIESRLDEIYTLLVAAPVEPEQAIASADDEESAVAEQPETSAWRDEIKITLTPGQGVEYKLVMTQGAEAEFEWTANGAVLNYDTHGNGSGESISYERGRGEPEGNGILVAAFNGDHGWFFRNRCGPEATTSS